MRPGMNSLKKIAAALISSLALVGTGQTADLPVATDRLPDELLGCWKWNDTKLETSASQTIDGSMTGKKFLAYVERCLAPTLKRKDIVMIDNLPAHKAAGIREAIEARGATLRYLPQYSPDLNPIEMPFSKLKASLRKAAERTIPRLRH